MKITQEIISALNKAIDQYGNRAQFAKSIGIAHSTLLFWLTGKTTEINGKLWVTKLRPALAPFLGISLSDCMMKEGTRIRYSVTSEFQNHTAKVLSFDQIQELDVPLVSISEFLEQCDDCRIERFASAADDSSFAIEVSPDKKFFPGKLLFLITGSRRPKSGDIVLARIRTPDTLILGLYTKKGKVITISEIFSADPKKISWDMKAQPGFLAWLFPASEMNSIFPG